MERSKSKFIFDFLPENTFNHSESDLSGMITRLHEDRDDSGNAAADELPDEYIIRRVQRHVNRWYNSSQLDFGFETAEVVTPGAANFEVFPRSFKCANCGTVNQFTPTEIRDFPDAETTVPCERCGTGLSDRDQMRMISYCRCGGIQDIYVPEHCGAGMEYRNPTVRFEDAYWRCTNSSCSYTTRFNGGSTCFNPSCDKEDIKTLPHSASSTFYPQTQTLINAHQKLNALQDNQEYQAQIISDYLLRNSGNDSPSEDELLQEAMKLMANDEASNREHALELAKERLTTDATDHRSEVKHFLQAEFDKAKRLRLSEELFEYLSVTSDEYDDNDRIETYTFSSLLEDVDAKSHLSEDELEDYTDLRSNQNLSEIRLIKNFPVTTVTYGYTRGTPIPGGDTEDEMGPRLNAFSSGQWAETQIFARTMDAEAVMISLDKQAVLDWLFSNNIVQSTTVNNLDRWFIEKMTAPNRFDSLPAERTPARHAFTLLHTLSHLFTDSIGALSGYGRDSLVEHILPRAMSFIIYKRPDTNFTLGSIFSLFEERFPEVLNQLEESAFCTYDSVCRRDHNGSCEDCLFLSNITCANSNNNLSRSVYFGGEFDDETIAGFSDQ